MEFKDWALLPDQDGFFDVGILIRIVINDFVKLAIVLDLAILEMEVKRRLVSIIFADVPSIATIKENPKAIGIFEDVPLKRLAIDKLDMAVFAERNSIEIGF